MQAARRYQNSQRGRSNHAQRQRRYRARLRRLSESRAEKVTHQVWTRMPGGVARAESNDRPLCHL